MSGAKVTRNENTRRGQASRDFIVTEAKLSQINRRAVCRGTWMARVLRIQYPGAYYHVTSGDNERKTIFRNKAERKWMLIKEKSGKLTIMN